MSDRVKVQRSDGLARITLGAGRNGPAGGPGPVSDSGFDAALRRDLAAAVDTALAQPAPRAVIVHAAPGGWPVSARTSADYLPDDAPSLREITDRLAAAPVPVVAVLSGRVSGAAHAFVQIADIRLALEGTVFDMPEFAHGMIPAAGIWVRMVRRLGPARAMEILTSGRALDARAAQGLGLIDAVTTRAALDSDGVIEALRAAEDDPDLPRLRDMAMEDPARFMNELAQLRGDLPEGALATVADQALTVAEAAMLLPLAAALDLEAVTHADLAEAELAQALEHLRAAGGRAAAAVRGEISADRIGRMRIALWNATEPLAARLLGAGHLLRIGSGDPAQLEAVLSGIARRQEIAVHAGLMSAAERDADWERLEASADAAGCLAGADLILAAPEMGPTGRHEIDDLRRARDRAQPMAVETDTPEPDEIQLVRFGRHVECRGDGPIADLAASMLLAGGDIALRMAPGQGLAAPLEAALWAGAERCVMAGARPLDVDAAMVDFGFAEGPLMRADRAGLDKVCDVMRAAGHAPGAYLTYLTMERQTGRRAGRGIFDWRGEAPVTPADQPLLLQALREEAGIETPAPGAEEIRLRLLAEMANAAAGALQSGACDRAGDLDVTAVHALGFPRRKGGPLFQADRLGLLASRKRLRALAEEGAPVPVTLWDVLIRNGRRFADLIDG